MPRVLIVDDHPIVRMGVRAMLEQAPGFAVCGEAGSTAEALRLLALENPDVTLLDLMLGGRGGADFVTECLRACPRTRILVLSQHDEALYAERALKAGAHGYLMKGEAMEDLVDALQTVLRGDIAVSSRLNARLLVRQVRGPTNERYAALSNREMQIFLLIGAGRSTGAIASELCLSPKTVGAHRENIKIKLGLAGAAELERDAPPRRATCLKHDPDERSTAIGKDHARTKDRRRVPDRRNVIPLRRTAVVRDTSSRPQR